MHDIIISVEDISEQLARRDGFLKHRQLQMTPEQRMEKMRQLQEQARTVLKNSPEGLARFMSRNIRQRATNVENTDAT